MLMCHYDWLTLLLETKVIYALNNMSFFLIYFNKFCFTQETLCDTIQESFLNQQTKQLWILL